MTGLQHALEQLSRHNVALEPIITANVGNRRVTYAELKPAELPSPQSSIVTLSLVEISTQATAAELIRAAQDQIYPAILLLDWLHPRTAETLFVSGVQYIDSAGNMFLQLPGTYIHVSGQRTSLPRSTATAVPPRSSPFEGLKLKVVLTLLGENKVDTVRALAKQSDVSLGTTAATLKALEESGFIKGLALIESERGRVLDLWAQGYSRSKRLNQTLASYHANPEMLHTGDYAGMSISGELAAADLIKPTSAVLFVDEWSAIVGVQNRWTTRETPNITIKRRFWPTSSRDSDHDMAPLPVTYAELLQSPSPRTIETAEDFRVVHIGF